VEREWAPPLVEAGRPPPLVAAGRLPTPVVAGRLLSAAASQRPRPSPSNGESPTLLPRLADNARAGSPVLAISIKVVSGKCKVVIASVAVGVQAVGSHAVLGGQGGCVSPTPAATTEASVAAFAAVV